MKTALPAFTKDQEQIAIAMKALGHPARVAIIQMLLEKESCVCGDIVEDLPLSQSTVSQHLSALKKVGLIKGTIDGPRTCYCIDPKAWKYASMIIAQFVEKQPSGNSECC